MLSKKYRLTRKQINLIYKRGRGQRLGEIGVKFIENNQEHSRYSVIIPKAVVKKVTQRNRLRRVIFDELQKIAPKKNRDVIIRVFKVSDEPVIRENIKSILRRIDV